MVLFVLPMRSSRQGRARTAQVHQYFAGILASGRVGGQVFQRESGSSINCGVSGGWEGAGTMLLPFLLSAIGRVRRAP